jgi:hypothetical protein
VRKKDPTKRKKKNSEFRTLCRSETGERTGTEKPPIIPQRPDTPVRELAAINSPTR